MKWRTLPTQPFPLLTEALRHWGPLYGPARGRDDVLRLAHLSTDHTLSFTTGRPQLPLKKFLLPPVERLWTRQGTDYTVPAPDDRIVLWGTAASDLAALGYLDRVWDDDNAYRQRRERLLLVGCQSPQPRDLAPAGTTLEQLPFDLFIAAERLWCGTKRGSALCAQLPGEAGDDPFPLAAAVGPSPPLFPEDLEQRFLGASTSPFWEDEARRCLACGLCSAVCPTCSCFDMQDTLSLDGSARRERIWDNCFFRDHGLVAGGHNFRPTRGDRLRFRFEHKFLGFGELRGIPSCVDCGRCSEACPVGIGLQHLLRLVVEFSS